MNESKRLVEFAVGLKYQDLSKEVIERAKDLVLDHVGVALASAAKPWSAGAYRYARDAGGAGESTIINYGDKVKAESAAFANATFIHGFEMDDMYPPGNTHPGAVIIPTCLAMGERELIDGKKFLLSVVLGYEVMGRAAASVAPNCTRFGFHTISAQGALGSAVATGKILDFNADLMLNALGIAASHASGIREYTQTGGSVKRVHAGLGASGGIRSALLAQFGVTGPTTPLEGKIGFCHVFSGGAGGKLDVLVPKPGDGFVVNKVAIKRHCCCYHIQAPVEATGNIVREHDIKPDDIEEILMGTTKHAMTAVGTIKEPEDITGAQFSAYFTLALCVIKGSNGFNDYTEENLFDPEIRKLAKRVRLEVDEEVEAMFPAKRAIKMTVKLKNGKTYVQKLEGARGTPENPMTREEVADKFRGLAALVLPDARVEDIVKTVFSLENIGNINMLSKMLVV